MNGPPRKWLLLRSLVGLVVLSGIVSDGCGKEPAPAAGGKNPASKPAATQPAEQIEKAKAELDAMVKRALELYKKGRYAEAALEYEKAVALAPEVFGPGSTNTATLLSNLAYLYDTMELYAKAEPLHLRSLKIREAKLGKDHPNVAGSLNNLAVLYESMGQYAQAEPLLLRSLKINEANLGKDHPDVARSLNNLAGMYECMGQYAKAEPLLLRSLGILEAKLGKDHLHVASSLNNLAALHESMGQYAKAEPLLVRSLKIREAKVGKDHPDVAESLNNLAGVYRAMGQHAKAEPLYLQSLKIWEAKLGKDHPDVALSLNNLALLYWSTGQYAKAEPLLLRSLKIHEAKLGSDHPSVATSLNNLAELYRSMGQYAQAEPLLLRSLKINEANLGKDHPDVARSLNNLAGMYECMGQYAKAEALFLRSLKILEAKLGRDHPYVAASLNNQAWVYICMGRLTEAWRAAQRGTRILRQTRSHSGRSVLARSSFFGERSSGDMLPCLALKLNKKVDVLTLLEQQRAMGLRELLAESTAQAASTLSEADQGRVRAAMARINGLQGAIEKHMTRRKAVEALRVELRAAERDYDDLMAELRKRHEHFVATETAQAITSQQIAKTPAMDDKTAIIGWVQHGDWAWGYVIGTSGVKWVDLSKDFDSDGQEKLAARVRSAGRRPGGQRFSPKGTLKLYRTWVAPLEKHLEGVRKLIVINQGWVAALPVEMLLTREPPKGETDMSKWPWLDRKYQVSYAPSCTTLDILCRQRAKRKDRKWAQPLFAMADPPFSQEQLAQMKAEKQAPAGTLLALVAGDRAVPSRTPRFDGAAAPKRLPGTRREVQAIADLLGKDKSLLLLGPEASERKLFETSRSGELKKHRYVHFATHGAANDDQPEFSGLVLARYPEDKDYDGVLHMREVFHLKLDADLVVLSACETGLGRFLGGEGMVGLSTAFFFAGTPSIVMSLWNAPDVSTALLMQRFYKNLKKGQTKAAALHEAKAWLRNLTRSELAKLGKADPTVARITRGLGEAVTAPKGKLKDDKPFAHPHYWAAFILTGDPR